MARISNGKKVGYTYYGRGGARHTGVTNNPQRRRSEHNAKTGGNGYLRVRTRPMSPSRARDWERRQRNTTGY